MDNPEKLATMDTQTNIPIVVIIEFGVLIGCLGIGI
jgi:hypothetical protein